MQVLWDLKLIRGGADKSLARPGRKQTTATKLGIYSTYFPRSSVHFLARCSNSCKPLQKKSKGTILGSRFKKWKTKLRIYNQV